MSFSQPKPPDPTQTANAQQQFNVNAAKSQNALNSYNQGSTYGTINYVGDPSSPSGYRLVSSLSPEQQQLYNTQTGTQGIAGQTAQDLLRNTSGMYSQAFNGNNQAVTDKLNQWSGQYLQPIFNQQSSNLEAELRNQGLTPGSEAYNNAKNLLARNQGDVTTSYLTKNQQQGFDQALKEYQTPLSTLAGLYGMSAPTGPTQMGTPNAQIQPANYQGAVQSNYEQQMQNYNNTWNGVGKLLGSGVSLAMAPFTGGTSLGGMFGSGISGWDSYGGNTFPKIGGGWGR